VAADCLGSPSRVPIEFDHHLSYLVHPSSHHWIDESDADAVDTRSSVEAAGGFQSLLVHDHRNRLSLARPTHHRGSGCTAHNHWGAEGAGNAYTVAVPGGVVAVVVAADEVVVGGGVEGGVEPVTGGVEGAVVAHKNETRVGMSARTQDQAGDSVSLPGSGPAVKLSRPDLGDFEQEPIEEAEGRVHCIHSVEGRNAVKALEGVDKYNGVHTSYTSEH